MTDFWTLVGAVATVMTPVVLAQLAFTKVLIDRSISVGNATQLKEINGTYLRAAIYQTDKQLVEYRLTQLEDEL